MSNVEHLYIVHPLSVLYIGRFMMQRYAFSVPAPDKSSKSFRRRGYIRTGAAMPLSSLATSNGSRMDPVRDRYSSA